jgi:hypothetical protein
VWVGIGRLTCGAHYVTVLYIESIYVRCLNGRHAPREEGTQKIVIQKGMQVLKMKRTMKGDMNETKWQVNDHRAARRRPRAGRMSMTGDAGEVNDAASRRATGVCAGAPSALECSNASAARRRRGVCAE